MNKILISVDDNKREFKGVIIFGIHLTQVNSLTVSKLKNAFFLVSFKISNENAK